MPAPKSVSYDVEKTRFSSVREQTWPAVHVIHWVQRPGVPTCTEVQDCDHGMRLYSKNVPEDRVEQLCGCWCRGHTTETWSERPETPSVRSRRSVEPTCHIGLATAPGDSL